MKMKITLAVTLFAFINLLMFMPSASVPVVEAGFTSTPIPPTSLPPTSTPVVVPTNTPVPANTPVPTSPPSQNNTPVPPLPTEEVRANPPQDPPNVPELGEGFSLNFILMVNAILLFVLVLLVVAWRWVSKASRQNES